ncbi:MAG: hypothetical protein Q7S35_02070 [Candidatus Limnocylindrales bacterium]|nr:hypothetical protein [Candidatus Limnocylindrales bacterium]
MTAIGPLHRLRALLAAVAEVQPRRAIAGRPIALGWATVELERAAAELGAELGIPADRFLDAAQTFALGARCRVVRGVLPDAMSLVLLEPATEGRLAATLARFGEGPAAVWLAVADLPGAAASARVAGIEISVERAGPFGAERLVLDGPIHGPHRLLIELAGTIRA